MRNLVFSLVLSLIAALPGRAFEIENRAYFGDAEAPVIRIISTTDIGFFAPVIHMFLADNPGIAVDYTVASSAEVMRAIYDEGQPFDLAISSAMDLQTKIANDGRARTHRSSATQALPDWANWRDQVFAFTQEPATIVISNAAFDGLPLPRNRQDMITTLRQNPDRFAGRVGTYDVRTSGLGFLFATQDARTSETYWRLTEVMGGLDARLYCCSSDMIDDVVTGDLAIAYNVLGSYAQNRDDQAAFSIVLPTDFATVMLRTVLIPATSETPDLAGQFADHLLTLSQNASSGPLAGIGISAGGDDPTLRRIRLGPGLLVFLDQFKNRSFIAEWESAILQN